MSTPIARGIVQGNTVLLDQNVATIPDGTEVAVTPIERPRRGSPAAVFAALAKYRPLSNEESQKMLADIDEAYGKPNDE